MIRFNKIFKRFYSTNKDKKVINISDSAKEHLIKICKQTGSNNILFSVKGGGCNGFGYLFTPIKNEDELSKLDIQVPLDKFYNVYVCGISLIHLMGTNVDWEKSIMGESFVFENPNAGTSCGCGTSFSLK
jgi:iron-sulfur cluster assembly accessory protein